MNRSSVRLDAIPGIGILAGGALAAIGCLPLLPWSKLSPGQSGLFDPRTRNALEEPFDLGAFAMGAGIALVVAGILWLFLKAPSVRRVIGEVATVIALVPILVAGYNIATMDEKFDEVFRVALEEATEQRLTDEAVDLARTELERLGIKVSLQPGIYLTLVGGLLGLVASLMALRPRKTQPAAGMPGFESPAPPPPPVERQASQASDIWGVPEPGGPIGQSPGSEEDRPT
jgi:hypothetical protein